MEEQITTPIPSVQSSNDKLFKISLIIIGLLIVIGLFLNAYLLLKKEKLPKITVPPTPIPTYFTPTSIPTLLPTSAETANWKEFVGKPVFAEDDWPKFAIKYPSEWEREGNILYPLGKNTDKKLETRISLGFSIRTLPQPQTKKVFPVGEMDYYWVKEGEQIFGYARIFKLSHSYFIVIENLPSQLENQYKSTFDLILSTFRFD